MLHRQFQTVLVLTAWLVVTEENLKRSEIIRDVMELRDSGASVRNLVDILNLLMYRLSILMYRLSLLICY